jgi:nitrate/nitrite transport system substrate-binding protein
LQGWIAVGRLFYWPKFTAFGSRINKWSLESVVKARNYLLSKLILASVMVSTAVSHAATLKVEKEQLKIGFIKLTDMVPLAIAYEKGYFEDEGLYVTLEPQANWKVVLDRVITGELDASHMLSGQPFAATMGYGTKSEMIALSSMAVNGKGITVSNDVWAKMKPNIAKDAAGKPQHPISSSALLPVANEYKTAGKPLKMGVVFPVSSHNYEFRYWLAAGGVNPGYYAPNDVSGQIKADVLLSVTPPPQMPATMEAGTISGYCVGEPWNQQAIFKKVGLPVMTSDQIFTATPDKVFGVTKAFADKNPNTVLAMLKAVIRASIWLDANNGANRKEAAQIISRAEYVGADYAVLSNSMLGTFEFEKGDKRPAPNFNVFFRGYASYPFQSDGVWTLTQMRRWGQIAEAKSDQWYLDTAKQVMRSDLYLKAAQLLVADGKAKKEDFPFDGDGFRAPTADLMGGPVFDGHKANAYIDSFQIGLKGNQKVTGGEIVGK